MNMCSKCYRDHVLQQNADAAKASVAAAAMAQHAAMVSRTELMEIDSESHVKEREASDDFMSGVHVLAGMATEEKAASGSGVSVASLSSTGVSLPASGLETSPLVLPSLASQTTTSSPASATSGASTPPATSPVVASLPGRCAACKRKVGLTGFKCRCNGVFCSTHRYSDKHNCTFDYKAAARDAIAKANPVVRGSKIEKI